MREKYAYMKSNWADLTDLTPFKRYEIIEWLDKTLFTISDDKGIILFCYVFSSAHLGGDEWYLTNNLN